VAEFARTPRPPVPDVPSCGVAGAIAGGDLAGSVILGKDLFKAAGWTMKASVRI
jgi:hypothetical protein